MWRYSFMWVMLVFPGISIKIFTLFNCRDVAGTSYLRADYRLECGTQEHTNYIIFGAFMILVSRKMSTYLAKLPKNSRGSRIILIFYQLWPVGVPVSMAYAIWRHRNDLSKKATQNRIGALYAEYRYRDFNHHKTTWISKIRCFWEVWEITRRLILASALIFVLQGTAGQRE